MIDWSLIYSALGQLEEQDAARQAELNAVTAERDALAEELWLLRNPPWPMFDGTIFEGFRARRIIDVYPGESLQAACTEACNVPGTAVMVHAGNYPEGIKFPSLKGGEAGNPIVVVSADGYRAATIRPPSGSAHNFQGLGCHDIAVVGFDLGPAVHGIHFGRSGQDETWEPETMPARIVIRWNYGRVFGHDGIKVSQTTGVDILDNDIDNCGEEGIDLVNTWDARIGFNLIRYCKNAGAIVVKSQSQDVHVFNNWIPAQSGGSSRHGICAGGYASSSNVTRPGSLPHSVTRAIIEKNRVENIDGYPMRALSAKDVVMRGNYLEGDVEFDAAGKRLTAYHTIAIETSINDVLCEDVTIEGNQVVPPRNPIGKSGDQDYARDRIIYTPGTDDLSAIEAGPRPFVGPPV